MNKVNALAVSNAVTQVSFCRGRSCITFVLRSSSNSGENPVTAVPRLTNLLREKKRLKKPRQFFEGTCED